MYANNEDYKKVFSCPITREGTNGVGDWDSQQKHYAMTVVIDELTCPWCKHNFNLRDGSWHWHLEAGCIENPMQEMMKGMQRRVDQRLADILRAWRMETEYPIGENGNC